MPLLPYPAHRLQLQRLLFRARISEHVQQDIDIDDIALAVDGDDVLDAGHEVAAGVDEGGLTLLFPAEAVPVELLVLVGVHNAEISNAVIV